MKNQVMANLLYIWKVGKRIIRIYSCTFVRVWKPRLLSALPSTGHRCNADERYLPLPAKDEGTVERTLVVETPRGKTISATNLMRFSLFYLLSTCGTEGKRGFQMKTSCWYTYFEGYLAEARRLRRQNLYHIKV